MSNKTNIRKWFRAGLFTGLIMLICFPDELIIRYISVFFIGMGSAGGWED